MKMRPGFLGDIGDTWFGATNMRRKSGRAYSRAYSLGNTGDTMMSNNVLGIPADCGGMVGGSLGACIMRAAKTQRSGARPN